MLMLVLLLSSCWLMPDPQLNLFTTSLIVNINNIDIAPTYTI